MPAHYFIGIKVPSTLSELIDTYNTKYEFDKMYKVIPHPEDLHVTLFFLGTMSAQSLPILTKELQAIADKHRSFSMYLNGLSYFGSSLGPRVIYLSIEESNALLNLQREIDETVANQIGRPISDRFTPHVTIAKKRKTTNRLDIQKEQWQPIEIPIASFALFTIHPDQSPKYEAVETFTLRE